VLITWCPLFVRGPSWRSVWRISVFIEVAGLITLIFKLNGHGKILVHPYGPNLHEGKTFISLKAGVMGNQVHAAIDLAVLPFGGYFWLIPRLDGPFFTFFIASCLRCQNTHYDTTVRCDTTGLC
jgi:hypothetical protein